MALVRQRMPIRDPMIEPDSGLIARTWRLFLRERGDIVDATPVRVGGVALKDQTAGVAAGTAIPGAFPTGLYRVAIYAHRTVAATSSSLGVTISWRDGGVARTVSVPTPPPDTSNLVATVLQGIWLIRIDPQSVITYEVIYDSVPVSVMQYRLDLVVEQVQA